MRFLITCVASIIALLTAPATTVAQYAADQPKTLRDVKSVTVNFDESSQKVDVSLREEMFEAAILELRKSGIRVSKLSADNTPTDALVNLTVRIVTGLVDYVEVRMDVEQKVTVVRTGEQLQLVTWYHEEAVNQGSWRSSAKPLAMKVTNKFISDWLDANNR